MFPQLRYEVEDMAHVNFVTTTSGEVLNQEERLKDALFEIFCHNSTTNLRHLKPFYITVYIEGFFFQFLRCL